MIQVMIWLLAITIGVLVYEPPKNSSMMLSRWEAEKDPQKARVRYLVVKLVGGILLGVVIICIGGIIILTIGAPFAWLYNLATS